MAKLAWIYKEWSDSDNWIISVEEPPSYVAEKRRIVYFEIETI